MTGPRASAPAVPTHRGRVLVGALMLMFAGGSMYAFSVFRNALVEQKGLPLSEVMIAYSINMGLSPLPMMIGGWFVDRRHARAVAAAGGLLLGAGWILAGQAQSTWQLVLCYGLLAGSGQGLCYAAGLSNTLKFFPERKGLISGLITGVNGGATIVLAPIAAAMAANVTQLMTVFGVVFAALGLASALLIRPAPVEVVTPGVTGFTQGMRPAQVLRAPVFWLIFGVFVCGAFSGVMIAGNASPIAVTMFGLAPAAAALLVSLYSAANMSGRLVFGTLSDRFGQPRTLLVVFALVAMSLGVLLIGRGHVPALVIGMIGLGLCYGGVMGIMPALVMGTFGPAHQGVNYGMAFAGYSTAALIAPGFAAGVGASHGGDYSIAFLVAIGAAAAGAGLVFVLRSRQRAAASRVVLEGATP